MTVRTHKEMIRFYTLEERFRYLQLGGMVGRETFGIERHLNQRFYTSREWKHVRDEVIVRDNGCDLGVEGFEIYDKPIIHHMNPIGIDDFVQHNDEILNPDFLVCVSLNTHNAIHYGDETLLPRTHIDRHPGDTTLWGSIRRR